VEQLPPYYMARYRPSAWKVEGQQNLYQGVSPNSGGMAPVLPVETPLSTPVEINDFFTIPVVVDNVTITESRGVSRGL